jgi:hypothetical protein
MLGLTAQLGLLVSRKQGAHNDKGRGKFLMQMPASVRIDRVVRWFRALLDDHRKSPID